jgi:hypothetical protein
VWQDGIHNAVYFGFDTDFVGRAFVTAACFQADDLVRKRPPGRQNLASFRLLWSVPSGRARATERRLQPGLQVDAESGNGTNISGIEGGILRAVGNRPGNSVAVAPGTTPAPREFPQ